MAVGEKSVCEIVGFVDGVKVFVCEGVGFGYWVVKGIVFVGYGVGFMGFGLEAVFVIVGVGCVFAFFVGLVGE